MTTATQFPHRIRVPNPRAVPRLLRPGVLICLTLAITVLLVTQVDLPEKPRRLLRHQLICLQADAETILDMVRYLCDP